MRSGEVACRVMHPRYTLAKLRGVGFNRLLCDGAPRAMAAEAAAFWEHSERRMSAV